MSISLLDMLMYNCSGCVYVLLKYAYRWPKLVLVVCVNLKNCSRSCVYVLLKYAYGKEKLELVVYVTLRKCSRACEYFSPRYAL